MRLEGPKVGCEGRSESSPSDRPEVSLSCAYPAHPLCLSMGQTPTRIPQETAALLQTGIRKLTTYKRKPRSLEKSSRETGGSGKNMYLGRNNCVVYSDNNITNRSTRDDERCIGSLLPVLQISAWLERVSSARESWTIRLQYKCRLANVPSTPVYRCGPEWPFRNSLSSNLLNDERRANNTITPRNVQLKFWFPCELRQSGSRVVHYTNKQGKNSRHPRQSTYAVGEVRTHAPFRASGLKSDTLTTRSRRQAIIK